MGGTLAPLIGLPPDVPHPDQVVGALTQDEQQSVDHGGNRRRSFRMTPTGLTEDPRDTLPTAMVQPVA